MHHRDPITEGQHFVKVVRNYQHAGASVACVNQLLLHVSHRADVQAPARLVGDDKLGCLAVGRQQSPPQNQLLHIASRERARLRLKPAATHIKLAHDARSMRLCCLAPDDAKA